jgi:hypothetical protein
MWTSDKQIKALMNDCSEVMTEWREIGDDDEPINKEMAERFVRASDRATDAIMGNVKIVKAVKLVVFLMASFMIGWVMSQT